MELIDTDIFIDFLQGDKKAINLITNSEKIIFSAITEAELLSGQVCNNPREREKLLHFLAQFEKIPVDNPLVQTAAEIRRTHKTRLPDAIIAATAITKNATLHTRNTKDFRCIKNLKLA